MSLHVPRNSNSGVFQVVPPKGWKPAFTEHSDSTSMAHSSGSGSVQLARVHTECCYATQSGFRMWFSLCPVSCNAIPDVYWEQELRWTRGFCSLLCARFANEITGSDGSWKKLSIYGVRFIWIDRSAALRGWSALRSKQCDPHLYHILLICIILHDRTSTC